MNCAHKAIIAVHPALGGFAFNPTAGGKDLAAGECTNVLLEMGNLVYVWPLEWSGNVASEKFLSEHEILWSPFGRVTILPTCILPSIKQFFVQWFKALRRKRFRFRSAWQEAMDDACCRPLDTAKSVLAHINPSLIHVHQTGSPLVSELKRLGSRVPVLLTNHSGVISPFIGDYDWVVVPSNWMRDKIATENPGLASRVQVIPYFLQPEYLQAIESFNRSGICFIGLLMNNRKGLDILLKALAILKASGKCYHLDVVGEGAMLAEYKSMAKAENLDVTFHGKLNTLENISLLKQSKLFCMPSREENFPIVYLEALACGTPIIGYPPAVNELNNVLGHLVGASFDSKVEGPQKLANLIQIWMEQESGAFAARREFLQNKVRELYSLSAYRSSYRVLYSKLLSR